MHISVRLRSSSKLPFFRYIYTLFVELYRKNNSSPGGVRNSRGKGLLEGARELQDTVFQSRHPVK